MTVEQAKAKLLAWVSAQIGYREGAGNFNKYAAMANVERLYGGSIQNAPWCDVFTDAAFVTVFGLKIGAAMTYQPVGNGSALCRDSAQYFKDHGAFDRTPDPGKIVFFFVNGAINHQGIVIRVVGGSIITVEGNSSDMVAERCYGVTDPSIAGYGRPRWELAAESSAEEEPVGDDALGGPQPGGPQPETREAEAEPRFYELRLPYLSRGSTGEAVQAFQLLLIGRGFACGPDGADGEFGANTESAAHRFQRARGLKADGIIGPDTASALLGITEN
jgi:hypothetical protein